MFKAAKFKPPTECEARHQAQAIRKAQELEVASRELEERKHRAAQQHQDEQQEHREIQELARRDDEDLLG
jgi:hypothetical protein